MEFKKDDILLLESNKKWKFIEHSKIIVSIIGQKENNSYVVKTLYVEGYVDNGGIWVMNVDKFDGFNITKIGMKENYPEYFI